MVGVVCVGDALPTAQVASPLLTAASGATVVLDASAEYLRVGDVTRTAGRLAPYLVKKFGASGTTGYFYPFGGFQVSYAKYMGEEEDYRSKDFIGFFAGADYFVSPNIYFAGELHLFDETSAYLTVGYKF